MKCPLTIIAFAKGETVVRSGLMDCLKADCAWWLEDISMCAIRDLALEMLCPTFSRAEPIVGQVSFLPDNSKRSAQFPFPRLIE